MIPDSYVLMTFFLKFLPNILLQARNIEIFQNEFLQPWIASEIFFLQAFSRNKVLSNKNWKVSPYTFFDK